MNGINWKEVLNSQYIVALIALGLLYAMINPLLTAVPVELASIRSKLDQCIGGNQRVSTQIDATGKVVE